MKKAIAALLSFTLLLILAACGGVEPEPAAEATEITTEVNTEAAESGDCEAERLYGLGMEALENGDADAAYDYFEAARANDETSPFGWLGLAEIRIRDYDFEGAEALLNEALEKTGSDPAVGRKLDMLRSAAVVDSTGRILKVSGYDEDGMLVYYQLTTYLPDGKVDTVSSYDSGGNQTGFVQLEYGEKGRPIVSYYMESDSGKVGRIEYAYDDAGNQTVERQYSPDGYLTESFICEYNEARQRIRMEQYRGSDLQMIYHYFYDAQDHLERADTCNAYDELVTYLLYIRDDSGRILENQCYYPDGTLSWKMVSTYDEYGEILMESYFDGEGNLYHVDQYE